MRNNESDTAHNGGGDLSAVGKRKRRKIGYANPDEVDEARESPRRGLPPLLVENINADAVALANERLLSIIARAQNPARAHGRMDGRTGTARSYAHPSARLPTWI